jgi:hypothetical protein
VLCPEDPDRPPQGKGRADAVGASGLFGKVRPVLRQHAGNRGGSDPRRLKAPTIREGQVKVKAAQTARLSRAVFIVAVPFSRHAKRGWNEIVPSSLLFDMSLAAPLTAG